MCVCGRGGVGEALRMAGQIGHGTRHKWQSWQAGSLVRLILSDTRSTAVIIVSDWCTEGQFASYFIYLHLYKLKML